MRIPLLILALLVAVPAFSQAVDPPFAEQNNPIEGPRLASPSKADPAFPLRVSLRVHNTAWHGAYEFYEGHGVVKLASAPSQRINFEYECGYTFLDPETAQFQARWIKPNKTLQVLLFDPARPAKPRTCTLTALAKPPSRLPAGMYVPGYPHQ